MNNDDLILEILKLVKKQSDFDKRINESMKTLDMRVRDLEKLAVGLNSSLLDLEQDLAREFDNIEPYFKKSSN